MEALRTVTVVVAMGTLGMAASSPETARRSMAGIVARIQKADFEGDRKGLVRLAAELAPYTVNGPLASRARYWRGFALWRRALNGFNEKDVDPKEIERDLAGAVAEFTEAIAKDPEFADAKSAAAACLWSLSWLNREDADLRSKYLKEGIRLKDEAQKAAPDNPRVLWVVGGGEWYVPVERGGGQAKAIETYGRGLELARKQKGSVTDPLEPSWGEPEMLMNLAWSHLNRATPDLDAAESNARAALAIVPHWHYVRDILMAQIRDARTKPARARRRRQRVRPTSTSWKGSGTSSTTSRFPASRRTSRVAGWGERRPTGASSPTSFASSGRRERRSISARPTASSTTCGRSGTSGSSVSRFRGRAKGSGASRTGPS